MLKWLWLSVVVIALDQITKLLASAQLVMHQPVPVLPSFNLTLMHNSGAAFSFLSQAGGWQRWFFVRHCCRGECGADPVAAPAAAPPDMAGARPGPDPCGALGNVWDRIMLGYVVDFVDLYYGDWHWPAFNVADSAITLGAVLLVLDAVRGERRA
jgi:Lipoprotein signal peptidase